MLPLVFVLVFGTVSLAAWEWLRPKENVIARRIAGDGPALTEERRLSGSLMSRSIAPALGRLGTRISTLLPRNFVRSVDRMLQMADQPWSLGGFLTAWAAVVVAGGALFAWLVIARAEMTPLQMMVLGIGLLPFPALLPYAVLRRRVKNRQQSITRALPDAMDLLVTCVEAGMGVDAAFGLVTERTKGPLAATFALYLRQVGLGRSRREALAFVADRTGVPDLVGLAASIVQGEELGTSMGDVLRRQSEEIRALRAQRARERAQRAPVLMTLPLVIFFLPAMGAVIVVPSIINLVDFVQNLGSN
ncbi:MAG: type II secretion system F family protein [Chloroflexi bacterium]|nr:type II secretion system F family protein [Chloroflexota bacterium]